LPRRSAAAPKSRTRRARQLNAHGSEMFSLSKTALPSHPPDVIDARRTDLARLDRRQLVLPARPGQIRKGVRPARKVLTIEALIEQGNKSRGTMDPPTPPPPPQHT